MTKQEAIHLEREIDLLFSKELKTDVKVSMALTGALKISVDEGFFNVKVDTQVIDWVNWTGFYFHLQNYINKATLVIRQNKEKIDLLMQSYEDSKKLEE